MIDLHMHSTASDGQYTPTELVQKVKEAGIERMALTDHDSVGGVEEAQREARKLGITCISGIELSIRHEAELHMLGYGIDIHNEKLQQFCAQLVEDRNTRADRVIAFLKSYDVQITRAEVEEKAGSNVIGRPHFARVLLEKGYVTSIQEAFDKYLATQAFSQIERPKPTAEEGIAMIHDAGGVAVLAHPVSLKKTNTALEEEVARLVGLGLAGIEVYYSTHTSEQIQEYHALAEQFGLFETAGSDFHGEKIKPSIFLGRKEGGQAPLIDNACAFSLEWMAQLEKIK